MSDRTTARRGGPARARALRLGAWALLYATVTAGILLHHSPLRIGPAEVPMAGGSVFPEARDDALALLVAAPASGPAPSFAQLPCDLAWGNLLLQEVGSLAVVAPAQLASRDLARHALVVVAQDAGASLAASGRAALDAFARDGGVVVWERAPDGAPLDASLSWRAAGLLGDAAAESLRATPVATRGPAGLEPADGWTPLARVAPWRNDGAPDSPTGDDACAFTVLASRRDGRGGHVAVGFPLARQLVSWQQGEPAADFTIPARHRAEAGVSFVQPNALVARRGQLATLFPHADAWERLVLAAVESVAPVPRLWPFPAARDGAWLMSHDDEDFGDLSRWMTEEERRQGAASTMYTIPGRLTAAGAAAMRDDGAELALHWWRGWSGDLTRPLGLLGWTPLRRTLSLAEQHDRLRALGVTDVTGQRVHGLIWDAHYVRDFRRLEAAGFRYDSTYGPAGPRQLGYQFGTGFPFHPLDTDGRPFTLLEAPFLYQDDENWHAELDETLLRDSATTLHQPLVPLYHATTMRWQPSATIMDGYLSSFARARRWNHWLATQEQYRRFWAARAAAPLARAAGGAYATGAVAGDDLALLVPAGVVVRDASGAAADGRAIDLLGRAYRVVPLSGLGGRFSLEAR